MRVAPSVAITQLERTTFLLEARRTWSTPVFAQDSPAIGQERPVCVGTTQERVMGWEKAGSSLIAPKACGNEGSNFHFLGYCTVCRYSAEQSPRIHGSKAASWVTRCTGARTTQ